MAGNHEFVQIAVVPGVAVLEQRPSQSLQTNYAPRFWMREKIALDKKQINVATHINMIIKYDLLNKGEIISGSLLSKTAWHRRRNIGM
jgi:hypothetical protein